MKNIKDMLKLWYVPKGKNREDKKSDKDTITTKNAKYVFINENKLNSKFKNFTNSIKKLCKIEHGKNNCAVSKTSDIQGLPALLQSYKPQIIRAVCMAASSVVILTGSAVFDATFSENNISQFYSAKSYTVFLNNEQVGIVRSKETLNTAVKKIQTELESKYNTSVNLVGNIEVVESNSTDAELTSELAFFSKLRSMIDFKSIAYAVVVNGEQVGVVNSQEEAQNVIKSVKEYFTKNYSQDDILEAEFAEDVQVKEVNVNFDEVMTEEDLLNYIIIGTDEKVAYTVETGDTYWDIAIENGMTVEELYAANPESDKEKLMPGDELSLVVPTPFINVNIKHTVVSEENINYDSETQYVSYMYSDQSKIKQSGAYGVAQVEYVVTEQNGKEINREEVTRQVVSNPIKEIVLVGTQTPPPKVGVGTFIHPVPGAYVSSRYGARGSGWHRGLDLAISSGTSIKAADGGTVTYAGWYSSYGYMVEINHGGGYSTRYAHCLENLQVKVGDKIYQGQVIAYVGSTGVSTGPHLHFEVRKYGSTMNPACWIGQQYK